MITPDVLYSTWSPLAIMWQNYFCASCWRVRICTCVCSCACLLDIVTWAFLHLAVCTRWPDDISVPGGLGASQLDVILLFYWNLLNYYAPFPPASCRRVAFTSASFTSVYVPPSSIRNLRINLLSEESDKWNARFLHLQTFFPGPSPRASVFLPMLAHIWLGLIFVDKRTLWSVLKSSICYSIMLVLLGARQRFATPLVPSIIQPPSWILKI